ncbi:MAG: hypothetical protein JNM94_17175 [Phycisphaerae bacterium]|nr:hypothetical protein [Phycisphaerae bacterium]
METFDTRFADLLRAASALASAHDCRMESYEEWDDLHRAILAAAEAPPSEGHPRYEFKGGTLVRHGTRACGAPGLHVCDVDDLEQVAHAIESKDREWFVVAELAGDTQRDWTVAYLAVEFLKRRGLVLDEEIANRLRAAPDFTAAQAIAEFAVGEMKASDREGRD